MSFAIPLVETAILFRRKMLGQFQNSMSGLGRGERRIGSAHFCPHPAGVDGYGRDVEGFQINGEQPREHVQTRLAQ